MSDLWSTVFPYLVALLPTIGVVFLFYYIMKYILEGDRRERAALRAWEAEHGEGPGAASPVVPAPEESDSGPADPHEPVDTSTENG